MLLFGHWEGDMGVTNIIWKSKFYSSYVRSPRLTLIILFEFVERIRFAQFHQNGLATTTPSCIGFSTWILVGFRKLKIMKGPQLLFVLEGWSRQQRLPSSWLQSGSSPGSLPANERLIAYKFRLCTILFRLSQAWVSVIFLAVTSTIENLQT